MSSTLPPTLRRVAAATLTAALFLSACGGDDDDASTPQEQLADDLIDELGKIGGLEIDEDCIAAKTAELTDEQAAAMADAIENGTDAPPDLTDWNASVGDECLSPG